MALSSFNFIPGIATQSLGNPFNHSIKPKLEAASLVGLRSVEIYYDDIYNLAQELETTVDPVFTILEPGTSFDNSTWEEERLISAAAQIGQWCLDSTPVPLDVICLQPFLHYEGLINDTEHEQRLRKLDLWIQLAQQLHTDLIQVPSNFLSPNVTTGDRNQIIEDMKTIAQIGAKVRPTPIRFAYEGIAWGTHVDTWDEVWDIVQAVNMSNFGTCIDTYNLAGRVYADPTQPDGLNGPEAEEIFQESMYLFRQTFSNPENLKKIFYVEFIDGERLDQPLNEDHPWWVPEQPARMTWSRNARLFPFETDEAEAESQGRGVGYLPVSQILDELLEVGYHGYLAFEVFTRTLNRAGNNVIWDHAERARKSWGRTAAHIDQYLHTRRERNPKTRNELSRGKRRYTL